MSIAKQCWIARIFLTVLFAIAVLACPDPHKWWRLVAVLAFIITFLHIDSAEDASARRRRLFQQLA